MPSASTSRCRRAVYVTPMVDIFNRMLAPTPLKSAATLSCRARPGVYSKDIGGVHFAFLQVWPDSAGRASDGAGAGQYRRQQDVVVRDLVGEAGTRMWSTANPNPPEAADKRGRSVREFRRYVRGRSVRSICRRLRNSTPSRRFYRGIRTSPRTSTAIPTGMSSTSGRVDRPLTRRKRGF